MTRLQADGATPLAMSRVVAPTIERCIGRRDHNHGD